MNLKELVEVVAAETDLPAGQVRKVSTAVLKKFADLIESQSEFVSPVVIIKGFTTPAKPATDDKKAVPQRKFARMTIRSKKTASPAAS